MSQDVQTWFRDYKETLRQEGLQEGLEIGRREALQEGLEKGQRILFQHLLSSRFGTIPARFQQLLDAGSVDDIERWAKRFATAQSLPEIFES